MKVSGYISPLPRAREDSDRKGKALVLLGSTGSIGRSTLEVLRLHSGRFTVSALAGAGNIALLAAQAAEFRPGCLGILDEQEIPRLRDLLPPGYSPRIFAGREGYERLAGLEEAQVVLSAQSGAAGLRATYAAAAAGKIIALANKESLVLAGDILRKTCARSGACILPVDSEHNAIFQCLAGRLPASGRKRGDLSDAGVSRLILTASGGPFFGKGREYLDKVSPEEALTHPRWSMGAKVTVDSATLMNKGLELIEAHHLYGLPMSALEVVVHRESLIHSLVEFRDGALLAQLGQPDMRIPIAYCLGFPDRIASGLPGLDLLSTGPLTFARPDEENFPCLTLARRAQEYGRGCPVVLNAANEEAVAAFLARRIAFTAIPAVVEHCLTAHCAASDFAPVQTPRADEHLKCASARLGFAGKPLPRDYCTANLLRRHAIISGEKCFGMRVDASAAEEAAIEEVFAQDALARKCAQKFIENF